VRKSGDGLFGGTELGRVFSGGGKGPSAVSKGIAGVNGGEDHVRPKS
jgi:hypothetical protein